MFKIGRRQKYEVDREAAHGPPPPTFGLKEGLWRRRFTCFAVNNNVK